MHITISDKHLRYVFDIHRKYTVIRGDSATGKTTLYEMLVKWERRDQSVQLESPLRCVTAQGLGYYNWEDNIRKAHNTIIFIDEDMEWVRSRKFASIAKTVDCYFVFINRDKLSTIPYSVKEIYEVASSGRDHWLQPLYSSSCREFTPDYIMTEDSKSGHQFFRVPFGDRCVTAEGKSNVSKKLGESPYCDSNVLVIADGAAFGSEIAEVLALDNFKFNRLKLFLPESFEFLLLKSPLFKEDVRVQEMLRNIPDSIPAFCESWEQFFTTFIQRVTEDTPAKYTKHRLKDCFVEPCCTGHQECRLHTPEDKVQSILDQIPDVDFSKIRK